MTLPSATPSTDPITKPAERNLDGNGSVDPKAGRSRVPASRVKKSSSRVWLIAGAAGVLLVAVALTLYWLRLTAAPFGDPTFKVERKTLVFTIVEGGSLESADNNEYVCRVKAKNANGVATTIKWLVDNTALVTKGDKLIELDDSALQENLTTQKIDVNKAEAEAIKAQGDYEVAMIDNENDIKLKLTNLKIAELNLAKWIGKNWQDDPLSIAGSVALLSEPLPTVPFQSVTPLLAVTRAEGDFQAKLEDTLGKIELAQSDRDGWVERASWSRRMWKLGFMSKTQADADQSRVDSSEYTLHKLETDLNTLKNYERVVTEADLRSKVGTAYRELKKAYIAAEANRAKADSERRTKKSTYEQQVQKKKDIEEEIGKCKMYATKDGLAVYVVSDAMRGGFGKQAIVQVGENVSEGQKLIQIPDLTRMVVKTRVHEAMVSYVKRDQKAEVRLFALPGRALKGRVLLVNNAPSAQDWLSQDVRVYETLVAIVDDISGLNLKPGLTAEVTIYADESSGPVLQIPIQSVVGNIQMGSTRKCFVIGPDRQPVERAIVVGMNNDKVVEVVEGLKEGEEVVINPGPLLTGENSKLKPGVPPTRTQTEDSGPAAGPGKKDAGKPAGKGPMGKGPGDAGGKPGAGPGGASEDMKKKFAEWDKKFKAATSAERKTMLNQIPEAYRENVRKKYQEQGIKIDN
jgi:multidrug efflux pump subunit AcrA (membrane-fusion protein)